MPPCSHELDHVGTQNLERRGTPSYHATRSARQDNHVRQVPSLPHQHETVIIQGAGQASGRCCKRGTPSMSPAALFFLFCLVRLSRHYLPPVADYGDKKESEVRKSLTVQKR